MQSGDLVCGKRTPPPRRQVAEQKRPQARPAKIHHRVSHLLEHPADHALAPGMYDEFQGGLPTFDSQHPHLNRPGWPLRQHHPPRESPENARGRAAPDPGLVHLLHPVSGVGQAVCQVAVVGYQQEALGVGVQPAHRVQALARLADQVQDRLPAPVIHHRAQGTPRLVEKVVALRLESNRPSVHLHASARRVYFEARARDDLPVNPDAAGADEVRRLAAGGDSGGGDEP